MKTKLKYIVIASLLFGASGFNSAKAITADELLVAVQQFAAQVVQAFNQVGQVLGDHETRISDNETTITVLENADAATGARITALEAEPKANIAVTAPTPFDDINAGYTEGSVWVDMTNKGAYILVDSAPGAAVWKLITDANPTEQMFCRPSSAQPRPDTMLEGCFDSNGNNRGNTTISEVLAEGWRPVDGSFFVWVR